jgi:hypothetical protein
MGVLYMKPMLKISLGRMRSCCDYPFYHIA